jgi:diguanylate cyclase (GGDEF)-like protein/PAS domain S-box-containing protein
VVESTSERLASDRFLLDNAPVPILTIDLAGQLRYVNEAAATLLGTSRTELSKMTIFDIAPHRRADMWANTIASLKQVSSRYISSEWRAIDGRTIPVELAATYWEEGDESQIVVYAYAIAKRLEAREQSLRLSRLSMLTEVPNSQTLHDQIRAEASLARRDGRAIALLIIKFEEAAHVNDASSHSCDDQLLITLAQHISGGLMATDTLVHIGDGEFMLLLAREADVDDKVVLQASRRVFDALAAPVNVAGQLVQMSGSIGVVRYPKDTVEPDYMLRQAQAAMRLAQTQGRNQVCFSTPNLDKTGAETQSRSAAVGGALERKEFYILYQPQLDLKTGQVIAMEALLRWRHPELGEMLPQDFMPLIEDNALTQALGTWVLRTVSEVAVRWQKQGIPLLRMAINMSPKQLAAPDIALMIERVLMETGLDPHCLAIEVNESMLMDNMDHAARVLKELRSIGIEIALDDFGVGYSSLSSLRCLPIDVIKIDRSLVPDVTAATQEVSITRAIINMAHSLQMKVHAIGVETEGELAVLVANRCDRMQGNYFCPPLQEADAVALLRDNKQLPTELLGQHDRKRTLLIVDDEESVASSLKRLFRKDNYQIITANSGAQGLQRLAECAVDVIISDQRMPEMTGVEFLRRAKELYPDTIRMVLSGYTELKSITDAINEGAIYKFLTKPWDDKRVRAHVQEAFHQKEMADENQRLDHEVQRANEQLAKVNGQLQGLLAAQRLQINREETSLVLAREILENMPVPVIGLDQDGMVAFMSADAETLFDGAGMVLGANMNDLPFPELIRHWQDCDGRYHDVDLNGGSYRLVCRPLNGCVSSRGVLMVLTPNAIDHDHKSKHEN